MGQKLLGTVVVLAMFALASALKPLLADVHPQYVNTGEQNGGTIGNDVPTNPHPATFGPVDQKAPLDFSTQPRSVPRRYVGGRLYNVQVLTKYDYSGVLNQMTYYTQALGVSCEYCHNVANFAYDTPTKRIARTMAIMVQRIQTEHIAEIHKDFSNFAVTGSVGCETCHRGSPLHPVEYNVVPVQYLDWPAKSTRQAGFVVNAMYSSARSLGVNCLFCHNSADFITLQYYPTNRIAHRMWQMLDDINHKYLPPNIEAVTCYTCHQGNKWPTRLVSSGTDQTPVTPRALHPNVHDDPGSHSASGGN